MLFYRVLRMQVLRHSAKMANGILRYVSSGPYSKNVSFGLWNCDIALNKYWFSCDFYLSLSGEITALEIDAVYLNTNRDAPETHNNILCRADFNFGNTMSLVIQRGGLSESRREYLYFYRETVCETTVPGCYSPAIVENQ